MTEWGRALPWRDRLLASAVVVGLVASLGAELLGVLHLFSRAGVLIFWAVTAAVAFFWLRRRSAGQPDGSKRLPLEAGEAVLLVGIAVVALPVAVTAWSAAPNNWDSLTYHLPRVLHWIQNRSLENYPTSIPRQLTLAPGAEILLGHLRLLSGSDRLWNLLQWTSWIGCIVAASGVARRLGGGRTAQIGAAVFAATLPMAILQGSSTQNDLVVAFWLLAFVNFLLRSRERDSGVADTLLAGGSLALAILTKATAYLFVLPFLLWLGVSLFRRRGWRALGPLALAGGLVLLVNAGAWLRNAALFGSPLGADYGTVNAAGTPAVLLSNLARNLTLHLSLPNENWNGFLEGGVEAFHRALGVDVNDPRSTWRGAQFHVPAGLSGTGRPDSEEALFAMFHDGRAGNPIHLVLLAGAWVVLLTRRGLREERSVRAYLAATTAGALLFCIVLRWQPWNARLQLPLFLLAAPLAAIALADDRRPAWARRGCLALVALALPWTLINATRPMLGPTSVLTTPRLRQYFAEVPDASAPFLKAARAAGAADCRQIGVEIRADDPEYLLWVALDAEGSGSARLQHVGVGNRTGTLSARPPFSRFAPCAVIALTSESGGVPGSVVLSESWPGGRVIVARRP
ncbi:MAG TPA: glycosyltransferase family 39 protein [Thermoanaerobaculia bacterium]|nr:glycosyltransferase family 39 protein [Thermoanaerobaculia bacterium]